MNSKIKCYVLTYSFYCSVVIINSYSYYTDATKYLNMEFKYRMLKAQCPVTLRNKSLTLPLVQGARLGLW